MKGFAFFYGDSCNLEMELEQRSHDVGPENRSETNRDMSLDVQDVACCMIIALWTVKKIVRGRCRQMLK